jgi:alpha-tubulin suppressor-like RCC1 family protein
MINLPQPAAVVKCGARHTLVLTKGHTLLAWGMNTFGQLGVWPSNAQGMRNSSGSCGSKVETKYEATPQGRLLECHPGPSPCL